MESVALLSGASPLSGRTVLVTGATGIVGSALSSALVDVGAHLVLFVRDVDPRSRLYQERIAEHATVVNGRLECSSDVERAVVDHEAAVVFHLGAQTIVGTAHRSPLATLQTNVMGTAHVMEAARIHRDVVHAVVVASSDKAYGEHGDLPYREDMALVGRAPYEVSKSCADLLAQSYWHTYATPVAVARCGNIYGPGDLNWSRIVPGTIRALVRGDKPVIRSDGSFRRDYLYVDDVVNAYLTLAGALLAGDAAGAAYNFSPERALTVMEIYREICMATVGEEVEPLVLNRAQHEIPDQYLDAGRARADLAWKASFSMQDGLAATVPWYRQLLEGRA